MNIVIKKAGIRSSLFLSYEFEQKDIDVNNTIKTTSDAPIHDDLRNAFRALIPHFAFVTEEVTDLNLVESAVEAPESYVEDREHSASEVFFKFYVSDFSIDNKKGLNIVTLSGNKMLESGDVVSFTAPAIDLDGGKYQFKAQLSDLMERLKVEVLAYMQGKQAPKQQMEMFENQEDESNDDQEKTVAHKNKKSTKATAEALGD
ncbi:hypothetical protein [Flavobacterium sp. 25HG05S-40]|uniref:hypothetical protein n=1 Tax=Flavobacterium sp. 25HG05S-40 TaxID=3458682 RepID=UPI004043CBFB